MLDRSAWIECILCHVLKAPRELIDGFCKDCMKQVPPKEEEEVWMQESTK